MTVTTQRHNQTQFAPSTHYQQPSYHQHIQSRHASIMVKSSLKASLAGAMGLLLILVISLIPTNDAILFFSITDLVWLGFPVVCLATGLLANVMAGDSVRNSNQGSKVGWMAGFWAGVATGIVAMLLAATGFLLVPAGERIAEQYIWLVDYGLTVETLNLAGRVFSALLIFGIAGSFLSAFISSIGGMVYPKLGVTE